MSGHSKWHNIQARKSSQDAKRGKVFTKITKEIIVAAKAGGSNLETNTRLRGAVDKAKKTGMPSDNIKKAIMRGTGELPGVTYEEVTYEAYGPGGIAFILKISTDNKNRTVSELRRILSKFNGSLAESGAVSWNFETKGEIEIESSDLKYDDLFMIAADAGAEDLEEQDGVFTVLTDPKTLETVKNKMEEQKIEIKNADVVLRSKTTVKVSGDDAVRTLKLCDALDNHDDVQDYYTNYDIDDGELKKILDEIGI